MDSEDEFESADEEDEKEGVCYQPQIEPDRAMLELEQALADSEVVPQAGETQQEVLEAVLASEVQEGGHPLSEEADSPTGAGADVSSVEDPVTASAAEITQIDDKPQQELKEFPTPPDQSAIVPDQSAIVPDPVCDPVPDHVCDTPPAANTSSDWGWGGWSSWASTGITQVAAVATKTGQGLSGAMETFEKSMGIPTPQELAAEMSKEDDEEGPGTAASSEAATKTEASPAVDEFKKSEEEGLAGYYPGAGLWSGLSSLQSTGTALLYTGIEQIEKASNQAYEALNDQTTEPGYTAKKEKIRDTAKGTNLMTVLQEARSSYEAEEVISREIQRTMSYLFDERQGLSQLEALDMLSKECVAKLRTYKADSSMQTLFLYIETSMELKDPDSELIIEQLGAAVTDCLKTVHINLPITKLNHCRYEIAQKLSELDLTSMDETAKPSDIATTATLDTSLYCIADFAARSVEVFKKIAELTLMKHTLEVDVKTQSDTIKFLNEVLCCEIDNIRAQFEQKLKGNSSVTEKDLNTLYLETSNAISYVQEPLYFFVPILQWLVVKGSNAK